MNTTLAYFAMRYNDPALWYLALFALTPHPYSNKSVYIDPTTNERVYAPSLPADINLPKENILRTVGREEDMMNALAPVSRKLSVSELPTYERAKTKVDSKGVVKEGAVLTPSQRTVLNKARKLDTERRKVQGQYRPEQIQAVQRKSMLRPKALRLSEESSVFPGLNKGVVLENTYNLLRDPRARHFVNDTGTLDRYHRGVLGQLSEAEQSMPRITPEQALEAKQRLASLTDRDWDMFSGAHRALNEIRRESVPVSTVITDNNSPIGRAAKPDTIKSMQKQQARLRKRGASTGVDPRTEGQIPGTLVPDASELYADVPSYVQNPESVAYAIENNPTAQATKRQPMRVGYTPTVPPEGKQTGLEKRIQRIATARDFVQNDFLPMPPIDAARTRGVRNELAGRPIPPSGIGDFDPDVPVRPVLPPSDRPAPRGFTRPENFMASKGNRARPPFTSGGARDGGIQIRPQQPSQQPLLNQAPPGVDEPFAEAVTRGLYSNKDELPLDQQRKILAAMPVVERPVAVPIDAVGTPVPPVTRAGGKDFKTKKSLLENVKDWYLGDIVGGSERAKQTREQMKAQAAAQAAATPAANVAQEAAQATQPGKSKVIVNLPKTEGVQDAIGNAVQSVKRTLTGEPETPADIYDQIVRQQAFAPQTTQQVEQVTAKAKPQSLKMKNLLAGYPDLSDSQKKGLLRLGGGVLGAGGVLLGGSMLADSLIKQKQQQELSRQERMYGNYPAYTQPPMPQPDPYRQQQQYY